MMGFLHYLPLFLCEVFPEVLRQNSFLCPLVPVFMVNNVLHIFVSLESLLSLRSSMFPSSWNLPSCFTLI